MSDSDDFGKHLPPFPDRAYPPGAVDIPITVAGDYLVVVVTGPHAGDEVTSNGVPWRGTLAEARALAVRMGEQARKYGHLDASYIPWSTSPQEPCACGHMPTEHDEAGCYHDCACEPLALDLRPLHEACCLAVAGYECDCGADLSGSEGQGGAS